jgi:hypothetical protein
MVGACDFVLSLIVFLRFPFDGPWDLFRVQRLPCDRERMGAREVIIAQDPIWGMDTTAGLR